MRCPLCDGPVVNGRCKDCGMPYRNDEILYHLNESRSDHYQHATDKARKIMREQQKPQGTPKMSASDNNERTMTGPKGRVKKRSRFVWVWIILILVISLAPALGDFKDMIQDAASGQSGSEYTDTENLDTYFSAEQDEGGNMFYSLAAGNGPVTVGDEVEVGKYGIYTIDDKVIVVLTSKDGKTERHPLKAVDNMLTVTFDEGDSIEVQSDDDPNAGIYMMEFVD